MSDIKNGDPFLYEGIYGRVVERHGGLVHFSTPHGTILQVGLVHFVRGGRRITEWDDLNALFEFEVIAIKMGHKPYGGRFATTVM